MKQVKVFLILTALFFFGAYQADCQTSANNAFGDNQIQVEPGVFAIYSGDVNQDGFISSDDVVLVDDDNLAGTFGGYFLTDLNGDSFVSSDDVLIVDANNSTGIFVQKP